jgi:hypothetical protein
MILTRWRIGRGLATKAASERALQKEQATRKWLRTIVVQEKLCPFAAPLLQHDDKLLRIVASTAQTPQQAIEDVRDEVKKLVGKDRSETHETTLIVLNDSREHSFVYHFRDFVRLSWSLQDEAIGDDYRDLVQLVLFHPAAKHQTYAEQEEEHAGDYTIRSPYPTLHLLRQEDVLKAVQSGYPDLEYLPSRNQAKLNRLGLDVCRQRWRECFEVDDH